MKELSIEQKPKFKVGDWIISHYNHVAYIKSIDEKNYFLSFSDGNSKILSIDYINRYWRLLSIQDAKLGDVLCTYECDEPKIVFVLKGAPKKHYALSYYCFYNIMYPHFDDGNKPECLAPEDSDAKPATKEQRDLLFQKMKEAGYEWDKEKKELKKIVDEEYNGEDYGIDSLWHAKNILEETLGKVDGYQTDDGILEHKCAIAAVNKLYKQKPTEWSEEDECYMSECIGAIATKDGWSFEEKRKTKHWLKSIKDRYAWKPSEEQMKALAEALSLAKNCGEESAFDLRTLHEQLKKL